MRNELQKKAALVPISIRLEITDIMEIWKKQNMTDALYNRAFDLYDIYWNENFDLLKRNCNSCIDKVYGTFKLWMIEWTKEL